MATPFGEMLLVRALEKGFTDGVLPLTMFASGCGANPLKFLVIS